MKNFDQNGSHVVGVVLGILVVGVIAFAGYRVANRNSLDSSSAVSRQSVTAPSKLETKAELQQAAQSLNSSNAEVNSDLNTDSLNSNLSDLL